MENSKFRKTNNTVQVDFSTEALPVLFFCCCCFVFGGCMFFLLLLFFLCHGKSRFSVFLAQPKGMCIRLTATQEVKCEWLFASLCVCKN